MSRLITYSMVGASIKLSPAEDSIYALFERVDSMPTGTLYTVFLQFTFMRNKIGNAKGPHNRP